MVLLQWILQQCHWWKCWDLALAIRLRSGAMGAISDYVLGAMGQLMNSCNNMYVLDAIKAINAIL